MTFTAHSPDDLPAVAEQILTAYPNARVFLFFGEMGAGKTTLVKALCHVLGVTENTSSPTFSIVNEYAYPGGSLYHFDFYRLKDELEAYDLGYEEYLESGRYCFVEWPEKIINLLPDDARTVHITVESPTERRITLA